MTEQPEIELAVTLHDVEGDTLLSRHVMFGTAARTILIEPTPDGITIEATANTLAEVADVLHAIAAVFEPHRTR